MWHGNKPLGDGIYRLSLDDRPSDLLDPGQRNAAWNLRTLVLMARAGLLKFAAEDPRSLENATPEGSDTETGESLWRSVVVRIRDPRHLDMQHWEAVVAAVRDKLKMSDRRGVGQIRELRGLTRPLNELFREIYTIDEVGIRPPRLMGSCPITRTLGTATPVGSSPPEVLFLRNTAVEVSLSFLRALSLADDGQQRYFIAYRPPSNGRENRELREQFVQLAVRAAHAGFLEFAAPLNVLSKVDWLAMAAQSPLGFPIVNKNSAADDLETFPRMTIVAHNLPRESWIPALTMARMAHILVIPSDAADPIHPHRKFFDVRRFFTLEEALTRLEL
jgi:hypothetical protein